MEYAQTSLLQKKKTETQTQTQTRTPAGQQTLHTNKLWTNNNEEEEVPEDWMNMDGAI